MSARRGFGRAGALRTLAVVVSGVLAAALLTVLAPTRSDAADLPPSILEGGFIISDAAFFDGDAMTATQIQTFIDGKVTTCTATTGPPCLENFRASTPGKAADQYCAAMPARTNTTAGQIIADAALACNISPKVILVMLQKEQGLVTSTAPSDWNYRAAMGQSCPDTAPCSAAAAGFVNQVRLGARQQQVYRLNPNLFNYKAGQVNTILWHPTASRNCGTSKVYIQNQATANLYIYTPYRPNVAALAAGSGTGDNCSSYGNRNFYNYYVSWFAPGTSAAVPACQLPPPADVAARSGTATVTTAALNARTAPTLRCTTGLTTLNQGAVVTVTGAYGMWTRATTGGRTVWLASEFLSTPGAAPAGAANACAVPSAASITPATGAAVVTTGVLNARLAPSTACATGAIQITQGQVYPRTATYGAWWRLTISGTSYWAHSDFLSASVLTPAPAVSGTPVAGQILTASLGTWSPKPSSFAYQWKRNGATIAGATGSTYRVTNDDAGAQLTLTVTATVPGTGAVTQTSAAVAASGYATTRVAGANRYETAVAVSQAAFPNGTRTVYLATGTGFADALAAGPLAAQDDASLLLVEPHALPSSVAAELQRLAPTRVVLIGSPLALDDATESRVRSAVGSSVAVERIGGATRYDTARLIAGKWSTASTVFVATGTAFPDALGAAAIAAARGVPVLLVDGRQSTTDAATNALLRTLRPSSIVVVGGEPAVSAGIASALAATGATVTRHAGADRYGTNAALNRAMFPGSTASAVVATGTNFPDALTGSVLAARSGAPLLVTLPTCSVGGMSDFLLAASVDSITLIGSPLALSDDVRRVRRC